MLVPSFFGESLLDDFFDFPMVRESRRTSNTNGLMQTDVEELEDSYQVTMNLPGFKKEDVKGELKDGYLVVTATTDNSNETKDTAGKYIRRERYTGTCSRSFYVGKNVKQEDIKAKFEDGTLKLMIPKKDAVNEVEQTKYISIEG